MDHAARFAIHKDSECLHLLAISYRISLEALLSSYFSPQISSSFFEVSVQHIQDARVNNTSDSKRG